MASNRVGGFGRPGRLTVMVTGMAEARKQDVVPYPGHGEELALDRGVSVTYVVLVIYLKIVITVEE